MQNLLHVFMIKVTNDELKLIDKVEKAVCEYFLVKPQEVVNSNRTAQVSLARGYIFYILHVDYKLSIGKLVSVFFRKKRVINWNVSKIKFLLKQRIYKDIYNNICKSLSM